MEGHVGLSTIQCLQSLYKVSELDLVALRRELDGSIYLSRAWIEAADSAPWQIAADRPARRDAELVSDR